MKLLVCGGRGYNDYAKVSMALDRAAHVTPIDRLIHGGASGADSLAGQWAESRGVPVDVFQADWKKLGQIAGPVRNQRMLDEGKPNGVIAFPGGTGTADMCRRATAAGIKIWKPYG